MPPQRLQQSAAAFSLTFMLATFAASGVSAASGQAPTRSHVAASGSRDTASTTLSREVFGFALASSLSDPTYGYPSWNFSLLSTVAFFSIHVNWDGTLVHDAGWTTWNSSALTGLLSTAHAHGTKVVLTIDMQDFSPGNPVMCDALINRAVTIQQTVSQIAAKAVDGVNLDYEGLNATCQNGQTTRSMLTTFVQQLRAALPAGSYLSIDTYASSATDPLGFFDIPNLNRYVDAFFVMSYDLEYSNWHYAPLSCSNFCLGPTAPLGGYYYNDTTTASQYTATVPAAKVILGVPYYGRKACVTGTGPNAYPIGSVEADSYLDASGESTAPNVQSYAVHRDAHDPSGQERWDTWYNTALKCTRELYWDDTVALGAKYNLVKRYGLRGVGIWTLNYGGGAVELWRLLAGSFQTSWTSLGGILTSRANASAMGSVRIDAFARGQNNGLWQTTWDGSGWSGWHDLGGVLTSAPSTVSSGPNRIDILARGLDNGLWHQSWNGTAWSGWSSMGGVLGSGPSAAWWAPGSLDVFALGQDKALWYISWSATKGWSRWQSLGGVLTSDPSAVSWGANRIDVFARGLDKGLWHIWWNGLAWSGWYPLGGILSSGPAAASCASGRLDIFANGSTSVLYRMGYDAGWTGWQAIGTETWTSDPGATCTPGSGLVDVFERGSDNAIWHTQILAS